MSYNYGKRYDNVSVGWPIMVGLIILIIFFATIESSDHKEKIKTEITNHNGEVVSMDERTFNTGPFHWTTKYDDVYKIIYTVNGIQKEAWVDFGSFSTKWNWDYIEN